MSRSQRRKGAEGERELATLLREVGLFPDCLRRCAGDESQECQGRDLKNTPGFCFQVAIGSRHTLKGKLSEARGAAEAGEIPIAATRRDRAQWLFTTDLEGLAQLIQRARGMDAAPSTDRA